MKKTIYTKNYKIKFIKNWFACENYEVKIKVMETCKEEYEGFSKEYSKDNCVGTYILDILNGKVIFYRYEECPSEVPKDRANMLRREWIKVRKEFRGNKGLK